MGRHPTISIDFRRLRRAIRVMSWLESPWNKLETPSGSHDHDVYCNHLLVACGEEAIKESTSSLNLFLRFQL